MCQFIFLYGKNNNNIFVVVAVKLIAAKLKRCVNANEHAKFNGFCFSVKFEKKRKKKLFRKNEEKFTTIK